MTAEEAKKIYQANLDAVSEAVFSGNADDVSEYICLPHMMRTLNGTYAINTPEDFRDLVLQIHASLRKDRATHYIRAVRDVSVVRDDLIEGTHTTHIPNGSNYVVPVYENRMRLIREGGKWKVSAAENAIENVAWPIKSIQVNSGSLHDLDLTAQADHVATQTYQMFIDALTKVNVEDDEQGWTDLCVFPHKVIIDHVETWINDPEDLKPFLEMVNGILAKDKRAVFRRTANFATALDSHTIRGYHVATLIGPDGDIIPPVRSRMTIRLVDRAWKMIEVLNSISNEVFPYSEPIVSETPRSELQ